MRVAIIGIGNVLAGDDAVGPHVVRVFEARYALSEGVQVIDAGTPGYDLTAFLVDLDAVVLVDAVKAKGAPGELRTFDKAALLEKKPILALSPHEPGVREALLNADFMGVTPPVVRLVGVIPGGTATGIGLSDAVRAQPRDEEVERCGRSERLDRHARGVVPHPPGDPGLARHAVDERAEPDPLDRAAERDPPPLAGPCGLAVSSLARHARPRRGVRVIMADPTSPARRGTGGPPRGGRAPFARKTAVCEVEPSRTRRTVHRRAFPHVTWSREWTGAIAAL